MKCTICGADNLEGAAYCEDCGSKLPATQSAEPEVNIEAEAEEFEDESIPEPEDSDGREVMCPACGADNPAGSKFCDDCGASLDSAAPQEASEPPETPTGYARLIVQDYDVEFILDKDVITIGRQSPADGIFPDIDLTDVDDEAYISRRHARILRKDDGFIFEDMGSSNGSFINNVRIAQGVQQFLNDGDVIRLGKTVMTLDKMEG